MRSDSLAGESASGKDAKAAASFNCLLLQGAGGGNATAAHSHIYTQIGQEKQVPSSLFFRDFGSD